MTYEERFDQYKSLHDRLTDALEVPEALNGQEGLNGLILGAVTSMGRALDVHYQTQTRLAAELDPDPADAVQAFLALGAFIKTNPRYSGIGDLAAIVDDELARIEAQVVAFEDV